MKLYLLPSKSDLSWKLVPGNAIFGSMNYYNNRKSFNFTILAGILVNSLLTSFNFLNGQNSNLKCLYLVYIFKDQLDYAAEIEKVQSSSLEILIMSTPRVPNLRFENLKCLQLDFISCFKNV